MTLIAAIPVQNAYVIGADTQETVPYPDGHGGFYDLRKAVQKLRPETIGAYQIAIVGAGDARLIEAFIVKAYRAVASDVAQPSATALRVVLEQQLGDFYRNDVPLCQDPQDFKMMIPYFCTATREYGVWVSELTALRDANRQRPEMMGWEHELYARTVARLFTPGMSIAQAILAALYVLKVGDETSNYIKEPFHVAVVRDNGIWMEEAGYIKTMSDRLGSFEKRINELFLACADTAISPERFAEVLVEFGEQASSLHKQHLEAVVQRLVAGGLIMNSPYPPIPPGTLIRLHTDGSFDADYNIDAKRRLADIIRAQHGTVPPPLEDEK